MGANPIQRQKRVSLLIGLFIGLIIGLVLCVVLYVFLTKTETDLSEGKTMKTVAILNKAVKSGANISAADIITKSVNSSAIPEGAISTIQGTAVAKIDLTPGTVLSANMLTTVDSKLTKDLRQQEYNMINLPSQLDAGNYIDIRLALPDGSDYIVIPKKYVQNANATTIWLNMNEEEILTMSNAIIEYYIMAGSKLYAVKYTDPGSQEAATPTYVPNSTVAELIKSQLKSDSNPKGNIESITEGRYTEALKNLRNSKIRAALSKYDEEKQLENIETKIKEEINNLRESREAYFGVLDSTK